MKIQVEPKDLERFKPRYPYESDKDFVENNIWLCVDFLEEIALAAKDVRFKLEKRP